MVTAIKKKRSLARVTWLIPAKLFLPTIDDLAINLGIWNDVVEGSYQSYPELVLPRPLWQLYVYNIVSAN